MPPKLLMDLSRVKLDRVEAGPEEIRRYNPQRHEFEQLDGIIHFDPDRAIIVGFKDVGADEFWVRGHIPERPLFPGVLMCEAAAQLCSYYYARIWGSERFLGFGGLDRVKFRGQVVPGDRLLLLARSTEMSRRRTIFEVQGIVDGRIVFEGVVTGMAM